MGQCFLYGNGGNDRLNLRVFGGTTAPSNPKDNDIWVKTSIAIPKYSVYINKAISNFWTGAVSGGIYIKFEAANSDVTYTTGANIVAYRSNSNLQEFNVNFLGCMQIMNGVWANVEAYVYHNGWHQFSSAWNGELFDNGNQYEGVTGGWTLSKFSLKDGAFDTGLTSETSGNDVMACTVNKLDFGGFSTLHIQCYSNFKNSGGRGNARFGICNTNGLSYDNFSAYRDIDTGSNTLTEYSIDISSVNGAYYVKFYASVASMLGWLKIAKMWLT